MQDYISLGPVPSEESCAQIGDEHYAARARAECKRFIELLRATFGPEPSGAYLTAKAFDHDFGTYYEVVCYFNPRVPASIDYAYRCEREAPTSWGTEGEALQQCPECGGVLEYGNALQLFSCIPADALFCPRCKVIYTHDRSVLARFARGG
jgi:uncharacterized C2H2 Zn-finger protein